MNVTVSPDRTRAVLSRLVQRPGSAAPEERRHGCPASLPGILETRVSFAGRTLRLAVRQGTDDAAELHGALREGSVFRLPEVVEPEVIVDIGARIGAATLYFSMRYPEARIYCLEPRPHLAPLLDLNVRRYCPNVHVVTTPHVPALQTGLGQAQPWHERAMLMGRLVDDQPRFTVPVGAIRRAIHELDLDQVDLFHLDADGQELSILREVPSRMRFGAQAYIGQLHGTSDWAFCAALESTHAVGVDKPLGARRFPFIALRKDLQGFVPDPELAA